MEAINFHTANNGGMLLASPILPPLVIAAPIDQALNFFLSQRMEPDRPLSGAAEVSWGGEPN